jgi:hypothetical protein
VREQFTNLFGEQSGLGAIAVAEGVDRALFRDSVSVLSPRLGSEVPVVLRFRGRGEVMGTVYASDGITPVAGAAVNLFPETSSRELGRGVFSGAQGGFLFSGVPLGAFSIDARTSQGLRRTVAGRLSDSGATEVVDIVLSEVVVPSGRIEGTVLEPDGQTPHPGATVAVVDDVMTTGATLDELARTLKRAGAARVVNWVVARTLPPS